jgi:EAL domain-containing protein (putative c-di-GMP-specific phosphodiesterase class I)
MRVLGATYAEELIRNSTEIIRLAIGDSSRVYHVGLTRCVVVLEDAKDRSWDMIANELHRRLHDSIPCSGIPVSADPVVGAYAFQTNAVSPRDVLRRLFNAADDARTSGRLVASYNEIHDRAHARSFRLLSDMRDALEHRGEFSLVYQPVLDLASGRYAGAEALLRWHHPSLGEVLPAEFIPLVEETAFTRPLTEWVLNAAIGQLAQWQRFRDVGKISINASARNLEETDFAERVAGILQKRAVPARSIQLEFTENTVLGDNPRVLEQLRALKRLGVSIAIDDFGTGYSALSYLQQFPANVLKIDRTFIKALRTSEHDQKLVRALIYMAHDLGYRVVAEGIEDREAYDLLATWKCDEAQGFYVAEPLTVDQMQEWWAPTAAVGA